MVPESGRFITSFISLTVVNTEQTTSILPSHKSETGHTEQPDTTFVDSTRATDPSEKGPTDHTPQLMTHLMRRLALTWLDFAENIRSVPIVQRIERGTVNLQDYKNLLLNLRQQVMEGARWITRAASHVTSDHVELRAMFIKHAVDEQKDFLLLEQNYCSIGGQLCDIQQQEKNIGSEAFSAWMFQSASEPNPFHLAGAMFIIEGIGSHLASDWAKSIRDTLHLEDKQVSFMLYHGEHDDDHLAEMETAIAMMPLTPQLVDSIVRAAKMTARLYRLQLEEIGNY